MAISAKEVNKLRQMTGAGMMDCKKALVEAEGDFDKAIELLRKKGQKVSAKRADRETTEGIVVVKTNADSTEATLVAIGCETDFVARNESFVELANTILEVAVAEKPADKDALLALKGKELPLQDEVNEMIGKIGEKIEIVAYETVSAEKVVPYIHMNNKIGVLVGLTGIGSADVEPVGKDVAMQIAAMAPVAVDKDDVSQDIIDRELAIGRELALQEGKPENIVDKIAEGKLDKFFKDNTLLNQAFVKDNKKSIKQVLDSVEKGLTVNTFKRVAIGG